MVDCVPMDLDQLSTPANDPRPDTLTKLGSLEIKEQIGQGGMGRVYRAHDPHLNRDVALKVLHSGDLARFQREAQVVASLNHPGIVKVYSYWTSGGTACLTMDLVEGRDLGRVLDDEQQLTPQRTALLGSQVARAVAHAHAHGVIHRDIKPANILIDGDGLPRVVDFGLALAQAEERLTLSEEVMGTPAYMAPEQLRGKDVDGRCDIYAIGLVLFRCLAGALPFKVASREHLFAQILKANHDWPSDVEVPRDLSAIVLKAMAKEPMDRYDGAEDLAQDLKRFIAGAPVSARPPGPLRRFFRLVRDNPLVFSLIGLLLAGSLGWLAFALHQDHQRAELTTKYRQERDRARQEEKRTRELLARELALRADLEQSKRLNQSQTLIQQAEELARSRGAREQILQLLDQAKQLAPLQPMALRLRGLLALEDQLWPRAWRLLRRALEFNPTDYLTHFYLYRWYHQQGQGNHNAAESHVAAAARYGTDTPIGWWGRADQAFRRSNALEGSEREQALRQAATWAEKALAQQPDFAWAILLRGNCRSKLGQDPQALADYDRVIQLTDWPSAYFDRGLHHFDHGRPEQAITDMNHAATRRPSFVAAHYSRGMARIRLGQYDRAMDDFRQVIKLDNKHARAYLNRGNIHLLRKKPQQALQDYERALRVDPDLTEGLIMRANLFFQLGRHRHALEQFGQALGRKPKEPSLYYHRGIAWLRLKRLEEARRDFDAAVRIRPRWADALYHRGLVARLSGHRKLALLDFEALFRIDPSHLDGLLNHGIVCYQLGRHAEAAASWEKALPLIREPALRADIRQKIGRVRSKIKSGR